MKNKLELFDDYAIIYARDSEQIIVDINIADHLAKNYKWYIHEKSGEPMSNKKIKGVLYRIKMKHIVLDIFKEKRLVYYKNKNPLDNRISNLTYCNNEIIKYEEYAVIKSTDKTNKYYEVIIDLDMIEKISQFSWTMHWNGYMFRKENRKNIFLHNYIMETNEEFIVDHIDRNPLNNRKENLRICTNNQNSYNKSKVKNENFTSIYKGLSWRHKENYWYVRIHHNKTVVEIGKYTNEIAAANAYNHAARKYHKEFAVLNEVPYMSNDDIRMYEYQNKIISHTKFTGITFHKHSKKWIACFRQSGKYIHIGSFDNELEAAKAYNQYIIEMRIDKKLNTILREGRG